MAPTAQRAPVLVTIDTEDTATAPHLAAHYLRDETWNGWQVPVATAAAFRDWIARWHATDPDGTWNPGGVREGIVDTATGQADPNGTPALVYDDQESDVDVWPAVGADEHDTPLYALDGWVWVIPAPPADTHA